MFFAFKSTKVKALQLFNACQEDNYYRITKHYKIVLRWEKSGNNLDLLFFINIAVSVILRNWRKSSNKIRQCQIGQNHYGYEMLVLRQSIEKTKYSWDIPIPRKPAAKSIFLTVHCQKTPKADEFWWHCHDSTFKPLIFLINFIKYQKKGQKC